MQFPASPQLKAQPYGAIVASTAILFAYAFFLVGLWPGLLGEDSLATLTFLDGSNPFDPGKTAFWIGFLDLLYGTTKRVEIPIIALALVSVVVLSRVQIYLWTNRHYASFFFCLIFIILAPHVIELNLALFGDGIFGIATAGLFFELYFICKNKKFNATSILIVALLTPFALFTRTNGLIALIPLIYATLILKNNQRFGMLIIIAINLIGMATMNNLYKHKPQEATFPLVIWETVNFLQPTGSRMIYTRNRITQKTISTLEELAPIESYVKFYDPEYWDPLNFYPDGPVVARLEKKQKKIIIEEFFKYNLWNNLPAFLASRFRVFLASSFAYSGLPWDQEPNRVLESTKSISVAQPWKEHAWTKIPTLLFEVSHKLRHVLWNPLFGVFIIAAALYRFRKSLSGIEFSIALTYTLQILGIFIFSIASENRYMTCLFLAPLALLPILADRSLKSQKVHATEKIR